MIGTPIRTTRHPARSHPALRRWWLGAALCSATVLTAAVVPALAVAAPTETCAKVTTVTVPGTWEQAPTGTSPTETAPQTMLAPVTRDLQARYGNDLASQTVDYSASITPTYAASESDGTQALSTALSQLCPTTTVVLLGYSQGAQVAGDLAARTGHGQGPIPASRVLAVGLVADPHRASTTPQLGHHAAGGEGVEGPRAQDFGQLTDRVRTLCAQGDLYCSASPQTDPLLTTIGRAFTSTPDPTSGPEATTQTGPTSQSSDTGSALAGLDASTLTQQVLNVLAGMTSLAANLPAIGGDLVALPQRLAALDVPGTHQLAGDLNNQFRPLVTMASQVDLHLIARILTIVAPADTSGITSAAAQIVDILAGVDINRVATDLGTAQETAWAAVQKLTTGDVLGAGAVLTGLLPVAADLAQVAANALTGSTAAPLAALTPTSTGASANSGLADLARQGIDAANFFSSGVHQNGYASGLQNLTNWLTGRINHAH
ncbi:cutinase family protein [Nocardia vaccinii]|uniref:cutinase family protein n=1 Tax=Nocardia vaccinii TaxID=1822 RepID=UPI00082F876E|nr:cutinase family protein [Nocardia vaccinii]